MLVQRRAGCFRLIRQNDHALFAARLAQEWTGRGRDEAPPFRAVAAIALHDLAWAAADAEPEWDAALARPRAFDAVDDEYREALYAPGLDAVERIDPYAALLASFHYARFLPADSSFARAERGRRERLASALPPETVAHVDAHRTLLRHLDLLSLFLLLADPGGEDPPGWLGANAVGDTAPGGRLTLRWVGPDAVAIRPFPFRRPFRVSARARDVPRDVPSASALREAWRSSAPRDVAVSLGPD
jgi:Protein of unknown function (DUF3891)